MDIADVAQTPTWYGYDMGTGVRQFWKYKVRHVGGMEIN